MYLTTKCQLRDLSKADYTTLRDLCHYSKNLYNEALYSVRQYYFTQHKYLNYVANYHVCKSSKNYAMLQTDIAQQTLKCVDRSMHSFFTLNNKVKSGELKKSQVHLPHYLPQEGFYQLIIPRVYIKDGSFSIPMSKSFKKDHGTIRITIPQRILDKRIVEVRIIPKCEAQFLEVLYTYEQEEYTHDLDSSKYLSIDLGLDNLATCVTNDGASFILDGKQLKSYNRLYNKINARLQSIKDKQQDEVKKTRRQYLNLRKRNRRINHAMSFSAQYIIKYCIEHHIGNVVVGYNKDWKRDINIGKTNNQNFVQIPHGTLRGKLQYLCELHGINYVEQEESYTSKASFFDNDDIPTYKPDEDTNYIFSGRRITRGQYKTSKGYIFNADVNGALNILRKCKLVDLTVLQNSGCVSQPCRIRTF